MHDGILYSDGDMERITLTPTSQIKDGTSNTLMVGERPPDAFLELGWWTTNQYTDAAIGASNTCSRWIESKGERGRRGERWTRRRAIARPLT
jgi:hypothetical protein